LLREGHVVPITPKAYEILLVLLQNAGHVVEKDALLEQVWPSTFVGEANLAQYISTLRKVLGEASGGVTYIQTLPKRGYCFVAAVEEVRQEGGGEATEKAAPQPKQPHQAEAEAPDKVIDSIAILPFINASDDLSAEYLSHGITESLINIVSQISTLKVLARSVVFHHMNETDDVQGLGRKLGVMSVLTGRVMQVDRRLVIRVELLDVTHGWQLWGEQYDRELSNVLEIQMDIAEQIGEKLRAKLPGKHPPRSPAHYTQNAEAYHLYLKGRYHWNKNTEQGYTDAINYFKQAIEIDSNYALAYSGLADSYALRDYYGLFPPWDMMPKAKASAMRALAIDDQLAEAHTSLACVKMLYEYDWVEAESEFKRAIELNPQYANAHQWYSRLLLAVAQFDRSLAEVKTALEIEPFDLGNNLQLGWHLFYTRRYDQALAQCKEIINLHSNSWAAHLLMGMACEQLDKFPAALSELQTAQRLEPTLLGLGILGHAYGVAGQEGEARRVLDELNLNSKGRYVPPYSYALIHTGLGEKDLAFEWLEKAYEYRNEWLVWLKVDPELDDLRSDLRFTKLVKRIGLKNST
jgi:TolB-like protein/Flp pilus assembly protein TadD